MTGLSELDALVTAYRTIAADLRAAEDPDSTSYSPIRAACVEPNADRLAREIADLLANCTNPVLV